jgi:exopolyphosphatase/guanosine-5'-triphosphate,3'-diphosphate pyrophosphatase
VLRRAADAERFIDMARKRTGIDIEVIPWQTEAALAAYGAVSSLPDLPRPVAMIDVGGGSSEVVLHDGCEVKGAVSIPMGAVGLWEQMGRPGCFDAEAIAQLESAVLDRLSGVGLEDMGRARSAIATGGTATTAAAILHEMDEYDPSVVRGTPITISDMERMLREISSVPVANRYAIKGLEPERADIFPAGLAILKGIAITLGMDEIAVSDGGILLGVLLELLEKECRTDAELPSARGLYI